MRFIRTIFSVPLQYWVAYKMKLFCCPVGKKPMIKRDSLSTIDVKDWKLKSTSTVCDECIGRCDCLSLESTSQSKDPFKSQQDSSDSGDQ